MVGKEARPAATAAAEQLLGVRGEGHPWSAPRLRGRGKQGYIVMHT
jgi:hypothetical protein